jgi:hypothetical protein
MKVIVLFCLLCFIGITAAFSQTTYYVDAVDGSDSNTGNGPQSAWQTVGHVNTMSFNPGDSILFKRGDTWEEGLIVSRPGAPGNPVIYSSYGTGSKPKLNIAGSIDFGITIQVRDNIIVDGFEITGNCHYGICIDAANYVTIKNCYIHHISVHNEWHGIVLLNTPCCTRILKNEIGYCGAEGIYGDSENIEIAYNYIHHVDLVGTVGDCIQLNVRAANFHVHHNILDHSNSTGSKGVFICSHGCLGDVSEYSNGIFEYNTCIGGPDDDFAYGSLAKGETLRYNIFVSKFKDKESNAIKLNGIAHHNIIKGYDRAFYNRYADIEIYNNIIDSCGRGLDANSDDACNIKFRNNILDNISSAYYVVGPNMNFESSNNLYSPGSGWSFKGTNYSNLTSLQEKGYDINSICKRPLFLNPERSNYRPDDNSPSIDKGVSLGIDIDLDGKEVVGYPDIGAYEFTGGDTTVVIDSPPATDYYIDPGNVNDPREDGSKAHPYDSWGDVTWEEGKSYLQKRGTTANEGKINIYTGNVTLGAYGEGERPEISSLASDFAIKAFEKSNVTIKDLSIVAGEAISCIYFLGTTCDSNLIENCHLEGADNGARIIDGKTITLRYNTFSSNSDAIYSFAETTKIYYNVFKENDTGINISSYLSSTEIYNNVFYDNTRGVSTSYSSLTIYNNIFYLQDKGDQAINHRMDNLVSDNNIFYPEQDGFLDIGDKKYSSLYSYQQSTGLDLNSFTSDPLFKDVYNDNFAVESSSPAIDAGRDVGIYMDFYGYSVPSGKQPDIGLIESLDDNIVSSIETFGSSDESESPLIFPNPSDGRFKISFSGTDFFTSELQIKDMAGNLIYSNHRQHEYLDSVLRIDISHLPDGIYQVILTINDKVYTRRIVKI